MVVALLRLHLHIPDAASLKDKRSVLKRLIHELRTTHNCAVAEVEDHDLWQSAVLAVVTVYRERGPAESLLRSIVTRLDHWQDGQLLEHAIEFL